MTNMATFYHNYPYRRGFEIYNVGRPFPGFYYHMFLLFYLYQGVEKNIWEINQFYAFSLKVFPFGFVGYEVYNFWSPYHTNATYQIW